MPNRVEAKAVDDIMARPKIQKPVDAAGIEYRLTKGACIAANIIRVRGRSPIETVYRAAVHIHR